MEKYYRDRDIAQAFGVSRMTVWRWTQSGRLPEPVKLSPNCTRWPESAIKAFTSKQAGG